MKIGIREPSVQSFRGPFKFQRRSMSFTCLQDNQALFVMYRIEANFLYIVLSMAGLTQFKLGIFCKKGHCGSYICITFLFVSSKTVLNYEQMSISFFICMFQAIGSSSQLYFGTFRQRFTLRQPFLCHLHYFIIEKCMKLCVEWNQILYICSWLWPQTLVEFRDINVEEAL